MLKLKYIISIVLLLTIIAISSYFILSKQPEYMKIREITEMDYNIPLAKLPQDQLFTYEKAQAIKKKAFYEGFPTILDEQAMLELTKHAYQWDKNAMIAYAQIVRDFRTRPSDNDAITLADFLKKYSYELVDEQGKPLQTPALFDLEYNDFLKVLASKGYVEAIKLIYEYMRNDRDEEIKYLRTIINGGYKFNVALANIILFNGSGYIDTGYKQPIKLVDHIANISEEEIKQALENYRIAAIHGNQSSMMRLAESYYYGIVESQDYKIALAWAELSDETYKKMIDNFKSKPSNDFNKISAQATNESTLDLIDRIKKHLSSDEIEQANRIALKLRETIVTWNYKEWVKNTNIPVQP